MKMASAPGSLVSRVGGRHGVARTELTDDSVIPGTQLDSATSNYFCIWRLGHLSKPGLYDLLVVSLGPLFEAILRISRVQQVGKQRLPI
jgi:hypothetical protein